MTTTDFVAKNQGAFFFKQRTAAHVCANTKVLVVALQAACSPATKGFVRICCLQLDGRYMSKTTSFTIKGTSVF